MYSFRNSVSINSNLHYQSMEVSTKAKFNNLSTPINFILLIRNTNIWFRLLIRNLYLQYMLLDYNAMMNKKNISTKTKLDDLKPLLGQ
jgi:hypothetical protein